MVLAIGLAAVTLHTGHCVATKSEGGKGRNLLLSAQEWRDPGLGDTF